MSQTTIVFSNGKDAKTWFAVNDDVMGGVSESYVEQLENAVRFQGVVRTENNGGFASMRKEVASVKVVLEHAEVQLTVRGDGQTYECRFRMNDSRLSYAHTFQTKAGEITSFLLPVKDFKPSFRGRKFDVDEVGYLDVGRFKELGILIANKQTGPFQIDVMHVSL